MIEEGITFAPADFPSPYITVSGIPVFYALHGDTATFRTLFGIPGIWTVLGGDFDAYPAHTTNTIFILALLILAIGDSLRQNSVSINGSIKSNSRAVNGILR